MRIQSIAIATFAALTLGVAACSPAEQDEAQADANDAGASIQEEAAQVGSAIAAGAGEVAQEVDEATDNLAEKADAQKAETATDEKGN